MMSIKSKVAIYCRLSEEDRNKQSETDDSNSIQNQKSMLLQYSLEQDWEVVGIYSEGIIAILIQKGKHRIITKPLHERHLLKLDTVRCLISSKLLPLGINL